MKRARLLAVTLLVLVAFAGCGASDDGDGEGAGSSNFDAERAFRDLRAQVAIGPRPAGSRGSAEEVALIVRRLRDAGLEEIAVQRRHRNVVARIPGGEPGVILAGAHHDTKDIPGFVGANDGASGVAVLLELARSLPRPLTGPSIELVFFDAEEARGERPFDSDGTRGSRQYLAYARRGGAQGATPLQDLGAMVLFDLVGDCDLAIPRESASDPALYSAFAGAAERVDGSAAPFEGAADPVLDDHIPFIAAGVPAVDLIDFEFGPGPPPGEWWHTTEDDLEHVCAESLDAVGEAAWLALQRLP